MHGLGASTPGWEGVMAEIDKGARLWLPAPLTSTLTLLALPSLPDSLHDLTV